MNYIYAETKDYGDQKPSQNSQPGYVSRTKRLNNEKEMQGKYETDALEDFMTYESKKFDKAGKFTLKMRNL